MYLNILSPFSLVNHVNILVIWALPYLLADIMNALLQKSDQYPTQYEIFTSNLTSTSQNLCLCKI